MKPHPIYELYRKNPPAKTRGALHAAMYWDGYEGRPCKGQRSGYGYWAWKAGRDNRKLSVGVPNR